METKIQLCRIVRNLGDFKTYFTVEIGDKLTKRQAVKLLNYIQEYEG